MCGRYTLHQKTEKIAKRFNLATTPDKIAENYNVAPGQIMPVITEDEQGRHLEFMKWGLVPVWAKDPAMGYKLINARSESIFEKPMWRSVIKRKRAIIPADGFYEWKKRPDLSSKTKSKKQPFYIHPKQTELFGFAGIWETWKDAHGQELKTYSIITTEPNKEMSRIHDRMPVILHAGDEASWLSPAHNDDRSAIEALLLPYEDNGLEIYEVNTDVNAVRNNTKELIYPLGTT
jgi:putative SOS response-associated peptidase YedK